ncbi:IS110 family transposase [Amycolatopsis sp. FDAARGOS 1241]|uniref:IS110 family transposase n=1 Tax=Amycolatopsis sp. FDAARGOS 1241 TaxID=2778070 RepID=UPI001952541A|nr:IS110 family transposase [Amycolatopsis sp. FDAARGOS 1241]QRP42935.1 IS110 family transposase [Amycolatopsis sp. FDAARGOS 1241]
MDRDVVIGIDPHKTSWYAVVVDSRHQLLEELRVPASRAGYRELHRLARRWPGIRWAIEGSSGLSRPLTQRSIDDDIAVLDVPSKLSSRVRQLATGHGRKTDQVDARSVAVAALTGADRQHRQDDHAETLRLLTEHRDEPVRRRTQVINRLHVLLSHLLDGGAPASLTADRAAALLGRIRRARGARATRRTLAVDLVAEVRHLDKKIATADQRVADAVAETDPALLQLPGVGPILTARIIGRVGSLDRFPSANHFASYCGTAPIEVSSGDVRRHRLSRCGDRQLNHAVHLIALSQVRCHAPARTYYQRKRADGKGHREAMRCLKRRLASVIYRYLTADQRAATPAAA